MNEWLYEYAHVCSRAVLDDRREEIRRTCLHAMPIDLRRGHRKVSKDDIPIRITWGKE